MLASPLGPVLLPDRQVVALDITQAQAANILH
jgi:hypothetical protein